MKMHVLIIYAKSLKNIFGRVNFSVKFYIVGGGGEIMACRECSWVLVENYGWSWIAVDGRHRPWMVARFCNVCQFPFISE